MDAVTIEIVRHHLTSAAEEMRTTLVRTAFNPVIYDVLDFGISLYDRHLDLIAVAPGLLMFLSANDYAIGKAVEYVGAENLQPGDVVMINYPYWSSAHTYDVMLFSGLFVQGSPLPAAYLCVRAHWIDLGAKDPGYVLDSTDMHQEGLVFPGTKIFKAGRPDRELLEILRFNSRSPDILLGDLNAMVAALRTGERRLGDIWRRYGAAQMDQAVDELLARGDRIARKALAGLPHGSWTAVDYLDDDMITSDLIRLQATVTVTSDSLEVDFAGSSPAVKGPVNMPFGMTLATCSVFFKALTSPGDPPNAGHLRPLRVLAEPGSFFHAQYPSPTFTLWAPAATLELLYKAVAQGMPDVVQASSGGDISGFMMIGRHPETGKGFALSNNDPIGWGACSLHDGADVRNHMSQSIVRNTPVELLEARTTMLVRRAEIAPDSGGPGRYRGGVGLRREIEFLDEGEVLGIAKKTKTRPWGLCGGRDSDPGCFTVFAGTPHEFRAGTFRARVGPGDRMVNRTAGGGGFGDPLLRDPQQVRADVLEGFVSREAARETYGVLLDDRLDRQGVTEARRPPRPMA